MFIKLKSEKNTLEGGPPHFLTIRKSEKAESQYPAMSNDPNLKSLNLRNRWRIAEKDGNMYCNETDINKVSRFNLSAEIS